jgi:hypothetical protein
VTLFTLLSIPLLLFLAVLFGSHVAFTVVVVLGALYLVATPRQWPQISFLLFTLGVLVIPVAYGESDYGGSSPEQFYYWAFSLFATAGGAMLGMWLHGFRLRFLRNLSPRLLRPSLAFAAISLASVLYGIAQGGGQVSDSVRQASGLIFLLLFFLLAVMLRPSHSDVRTILRTVRDTVLGYCLFYLFRYLPVGLRTGDFNRERSPLLYFAGLFAAISLAALLFSPHTRKLFEVLRLAVFSAASILSGSRAVVASMLITMMILALWRMSSRQRRLIGLILVGSLLVVPSVFVLNLPVIDANGFFGQVASRFVLSPTADSSFLARVSEMTSIVQVVGKRPLLGGGMGARFVWIDPEQGEVETAFVDNGVGFLLLKMGILGLTIFVWWSWGLTRWMYRLWKAESRFEDLVLLSTLVFYLTFLPFGPSFFQFTMSFWLGTTVGFLFSITSLNSKFGIGESNHILAQALGARPVQNFGHPLA